MRALGLGIAAAMALMTAAMAESLPPGVQPVYSGAHGAWQVACARITAQNEVFCRIGQGQTVQGDTPMTLILGVHLRRDGEFVFLHLAPGFQKGSNITFVTDKKEAGELKEVDGSTLRIFPDESQARIKQFMAGNILVVQFVPNGANDKKIARFDLAGFTASMNDARAQLKAALGG